jgi:hypothetical protein
MGRGQVDPRKLLDRLLPKSSASWLIAFVLLVSAPWATVADPFGASLHNDAATTFRVGAPFVDAVGVKINGAPSRRIGLGYARRAGANRSPDPRIHGSLALKPSQQNDCSLRRYCINVM